MRDLPLKRYSYRKLFEMAKSGKLNSEELKKSVFYSEIEERIKIFPMLEEALDSNELMIKYKRGAVKGTVIAAEYIIVYQHGKLPYIILLDTMTIQANILESPFLEGKMISL